MGHSLENKSNIYDKFFAGLLANAQIISHQSQDKNSLLINNIGCTYAMSYLIYEVSGALHKLFDTTIYIDCSLIQFVKLKLKKQTRFLKWNKTNKDKKGTFLSIDEITHLIKAFQNSNYDMDVQDINEMCALYYGVSEK